MTLTFNNITVTAPNANQGENKEILHGISGRAREGTLLAVVGPTGSGKTTMLNRLSHRLDNKLRYSGVVHYGDKKWDKDLKSNIGFVEQDDIVHTGLTVRQSLDFMSRLVFFYKLYFYLFNLPLTSLLSTLY